MHQNPADSDRTDIHENQRENFESYTRFLKPCMIFDPAFLRSEGRKSSFFASLRSPSSIQIAQFVWGVGWAGWWYTRGSESGAVWMEERDEAGGLEGFGWACERVCAQVRPCACWQGNSEGASSVAATHLSPFSLPLPPPFDFTHSAHGV